MTPPSPSSRGTTARHAWLALLLAGIVTAGLIWLEIVPNYQVDRLKDHGPLWRDHPTFLIGDCPYYRATLISLVEDWDLDVKNNLEPEQYKADWSVAEGPNGGWYPKHSILMPIATIPFYVLGGDPGILVFNLVQLTALLLAMWWGARLYTSDTIAFGLVLWFAFGTMLRPAAYNYAPDVFSTLLVTAGLVALLAERSVWAGLLLGFALWGKISNFVFLPLPLLYFLLRRDLSGCLRYAAAAAVPVLIFLALNYYMFGSPFLTGYDRVLSFHDGEITLAPSHRGSFTNSFWSGIWRELRDPTTGLLYNCPPILLAPFGLFILARRAPADALVLGSACFAQLALFATYQGSTSGSYGPRFLLSVVALSALLAAPAVERMLAKYPATPST